MSGDMQDLRSEEDIYMYLFISLDVDQPVLAYFSSPSEYITINISLRSAYCLECDCLVALSRQLQYLSARLFTPLFVHLRHRPLL